MIDKELMSKFDRIEGNSVSEEMLGAYLEGNLSSSEKVDVESAIQENSYLSKLADANYESDIDLDLSEELFIEDFELPIIPDDSFIELDLEYSSELSESEDFDYIATCAVDNNYSHEESYADEIIDNMFEDDGTSFESSNDNDISDYE
ncbi:MAG: hypothetical protein K2G24_05255 [Muribaculaceae bacterium]|nr:hypothetical protein [Muribaculaceae bacterium]